MSNSDHDEEQTGLTDPYGRLAFIIGSEDDFVCLDAAMLPNNTVAIHSVVNSETSSFIADYAYIECQPANAVHEAQGMIDMANEWVGTNLSEDEQNLAEDKEHADAFIAEVTAIVAESTRPE